jgi:hypothetical protein
VILEGLVHIAPLVFQRYILTKQKRNISSSLSHHTISYQGGGDYRGIYEIGLKGAFMGYRGLLLNDPYKRDRIDGCMLDIFRL